MSDAELSSKNVLSRCDLPGAQPVPVFCIRYQAEGMERTKPVRITHIKGNTICAGRPFLLEKEQECRLLLFCKEPEMSCWVDAVVVDPPAPLEHDARFKGLRVLGQGKFLIHDYIEAVGKSMLDFFQAFEQYQHFTQEDCEQLAKLAGTRELQKGEVLYRAGDHSPDENDLYLVTGGTMKVYKQDPKDPADNIAAIVIGHFLGEMTLVIDQPHSASIAALLPAWLIQYSRTGLRHLEFSEPQLFIKLYKLIAQTLVRRLGRTTARWKKYHE